MIRVLLPTHLGRLAGISQEVHLEVPEPQTLFAVLEAMEACYPMLQGTIRDHISKDRRPFIRFFVCGEDWSHDMEQVVLPEKIKTGAEPVRIIGAMAGG